MVQERSVAIWCQSMLDLERMCDCFPIDYEGDIRGKIRHCYISHVCHQPCLKRIVGKS